MVDPEFKSGAGTSASLTNKKAINSENNSKVKLRTYSTPSSPGITAFNPILSAGRVYTFSSTNAHRVLSGASSQPLPPPCVSSDTPIASLRLFLR